MIISTRIPPIYFKCKEVFGVNWDFGIAITYGDTVYSKNPIPLHIRAHEQVHIEQQAIKGAKEWWDRYLVEKEFRLSQEIPAYKAQAEYIKAHNKGWMPQIRKLAADMESMYGGMITYKEALNLLL